MKRTRNIIACLAVLCTSLLLASCDTAVKIAGEYSYKLSGSVEVDSQTVTLPNEQGTLKLLQKTDGDMLLTVSQLRGGVYAIEAELSDTALALYPFERQVTLTFIVPDTNILGDEYDRSVTETFDVEVTGTGTLYKGTIVFDLYYRGESQSSDAVLTGENILIVANKN